jgi:hypothetical protein
MIDDDGWIYVNGQLAGESHDWQNECVVNVSTLLRPGENTIAIVVKNTDGAGGLNRGVALEFEQKRNPPDWQRSAFNGLAQVIVQANHKPGEIKLAAHAEGLASGDVGIHTANSPRPALP